MKLKKSHKWDEVPTVFARCPYCGWWRTYEMVECMEGDILACKFCNKRFQLGRQR